MYNVSDIMTRQLVTLKESDDLALADSIFHLGKVRHLPVVKNGRLVGLLTQRDLLRAYIPRGEMLGASGLAGDHMRKDVAKVQPGTPLRRALRLMLRNKYGCLPVVNPRTQKLVGIVTEADMVKFAVHLLDEMEKVERAARSFVEDKAA